MFPEVLASVVAGDRAASLVADVMSSVDREKYENLLRSVPVLRDSLARWRRQNAHAPEMLQNAIAVWQARLALSFRKTFVEQFYASLDALDERLPPVDPRDTLGSDAGSHMGEDADMDVAEEAAAAAGDSEGRDSDASLDSWQKWDMEWNAQRDETPSRESLPYRDFMASTLPASSSVSGQKVYGFQSC